MTQTNSNSAANPTWYGDIRNMFTKRDIDHMLNYAGLYGVDLSSYDYVSGHAALIYQQVASGNMPKGGPRWSQEWLATFLDWMEAGCPQGIPTQTRLFAMKLASAPVSTATRIRKDITTLSKTELDTLTTAFQGMMAKDPADPTSYFAQAGYHWLPEPNLYCMHHAPAYNPWHRAYLVSFEDALRTVPGCEKVTLPYWDITAPFPEVLKSGPFASYTFPQIVGPAPYIKGYTTQRFDYLTIQQNLLKYKVTDSVNRALAQTTWEGFHGLFADAPNNTIINAHDMGHNSIGPTMQDQDVAAFDPIFWFFHCNWDRLFWVWQQKMVATDRNGLLSTINKVTDIASFQTFTVPAVGTLPPFTANAPKLNAVDIIDTVNNLSINYQNPPAAPQIALRAQANLATTASKKFTVKTDFVNVRVNGLNRLKIPGSFDVHLMKDGKVLATTGFFQPNEVEKCENCVNNAVVHFDFELPLSDVSDGKLSVSVEPFNKDFIGDEIPGSMMGNPTVEVHFLLRNE